MLERTYVRKRLKIILTSESLLLYPLASLWHLFAHSDVAKHRRYVAQWGPVQV